MQAGIVFPVIRYPVIRNLVWAVVAVLLTSCGNMTASVRDEIYPTDFNVDDGEALSSRMRQLGYELQQLDLALASDYDGRTDVQQTVVSSLRQVERIAGLVRAADIPANHPFLEEDMTEFLANVREARSAAADNPPRYYMAGRISGGCVNCHRANR